MANTGGNAGTPGGETGPPGGLVPIPDINDPDVTIDDVAYAFHINALMSGQESTLAEWKAYLVYYQAKQEEGDTPTDADWARFGLGNIPTSIRNEVSRTITSKIERDSEIRRTSRLYVDVPTADEFMDDFQVGFNAFAEEAVKNGTINSRQRGWIGDMAQDFFEMYMGELGSRAARGEDIFRVVGLNAEEEKIGHRMGDVTEETVKETTKEEQQVSEETKATAGDGDLRETGRPSSESTTVDETTTQEGTSSTAGQETEEIFKRNRLAVVHDLSPAAFMMQRFKRPEDLATFVASTRGNRAARDRFLHEGRGVSSARRV